MGVELRDRTDDAARVFADVLRMDARVALSGAHHERPFASGFVDVVIAAVNQWTPAMDPALLLPSPLLGTVVGSRREDLPVPCSFTSIKVRSGTGSLFV